MAGKSGMDLRGYRDYRGIKVIGAWVWDADLGLGITAEIDVSEAYRILLSERIIITVLTLFASGLLVGVAVIFSLNRGRITKIRDQLQSILHNTTSLVYIKDLMGRYVLVNREFKGLIGLSESEVVGKTDYELFPKQFADTVLEHDQEVLKTGKPLEFEEVGHFDEGERTYLSVRFPLRDVDDKAYAVCGISTDITRRKRLEEQFLQAQKMEVVGRLAGGIAHDFNNLLTGISGYTQLLLQNVEPDSDMGKDLLEIHALGDRAAGLTRQLLAFSRRQPLELAVFNLNETIEDASKMLARFIGEDIDLKFLGSADLGTVKGDPAQIEQVLMNLAINARDAMPSGGRLIIETANIDLDQEYVDKHLEVKPGPYVMLAVTDDGHGMDRETLDRIFEPFFTTKDKEKGTGLGLATVYGIVRQHNGHTWVYSEPGKGTTFKIYLPRVDEKAQELPAKAEGEVLPEGSETILVAEDERTVRDVVERILEGLGYKIFAADGPEEAEGVFAERGREIDLLLTDVIMPGCSGPELYERLAAKRPSLKVLYISGYTDAAVLRNHVLDAGVSFIQKPFSPRSLAQKVREVLEGGKTEGEE